MDSVLYEDEDAPAEEVARYMNMASLWPEWQVAASCLGQEDALFFGASEPEVRPPYTLSDIKKARAICNACPVAVNCLRMALANREEYGVWAGTTRKQRKRMIGQIDRGETTVNELVAKFEATRV